MPTKEPAAFTPSALNPYPAIPCCTILLRLLPHTQFSVPAPSYLMGYYFSNDAKPNNSELEVISSFQKDNSFPKLVQDMAIHLINKEQSKVTLDHLEAWYVERLDEKRHSRPEHFPKYINIHHAVRYRQEVGIRIKVKQAFGLKAGGYYVNVLARVLKGATSMHLPELPQQWAGEEKFLTSQLDFTSLQSSPRWTDPSVVLHPYLDDHSVLLIQIFGLNAIYVPDPSGQRPGKVISHPGQILELNTQSQLGWTAVPLFDSDYVRSGVHSAPLFQGSPSAEFFQSIISQPVKDVMAEGIKKKTLKLLPTFGSVTLEFWDGHYFEEEHYELPVLNNLLTVANTKKFVDTQANKRGQELSQLVLHGMDKKIRKLGRHSPEYYQQEYFYKEAMGNAFYSLVEKVLLNAGYGHL
ncbi:uncharacterized protein LOC135976648 [Chrysemys picta bellii]|uniref:uncharacterized protein LOC135976648 n=1 Tax=Chrysemys picta bellii TaxID=8478 RepID=UPI0032B14326